MRRRARSAAVIEPILYVCERCVVKRSPIYVGQRIQVMGSSCSGKSTLAAALAGALGAPLVELDALNWRPNWVGLNDVDPDEFQRLISESTRGNAWVVAGS